VLVSNNRYLLGPTLGSGTRPRLDEGVLGVVDFHPPGGGDARSSARWRELVTTGLEVDSARPVPLGIDGEAVTLAPPLRFRTRAGALRVRIARGHPGAYPSADLPDGICDGFAELVHRAIG
jgi:hypothetical protein